MEIKFKQGDSVAIPEGCKAVVNDGMVVFEKEEREFKDGDILADHSFGGNIIFIYKGRRNENGSYLAHVMLTGFGDIETNRACCNAPRPVSMIELATEEEKHLLFDKMKEQGLKWNAEEKRVEKVRWRAKEGEDYWYISSECTVIEDTMKAEETMIGAGTIEEWKNYNHFRTEEQAEKASEVVKEALRKFHEENE